VAHFVMFHLGTVPGGGVCRTTREEGYQNGILTHEGACPWAGRDECYFWLAGRGAIERQNAVLSGWGGGGNPRDEAKPADKMVDSRQAPPGQRRKDDHGKKVSECRAAIAVPKKEKERSQPQ